MHHALLVALALGLGPGLLRAQNRSAPFATLDPTLTVVADISHGALHRWWLPGPAVGLTVTTPFYLGDLELGAQYAHPTARRNEVPGFRSLFVYAGWGGRRHLGRGVSAGGTVRVGVMAMRFDGDSLPPFRSRESELGLAGRASLRWMPGDAWFAEGSLGYQSILTQPRLEQVFLAAGVGRRFATPAWLRDFLD